MRRLSQDAQMLFRPRCVRNGDELLVPLVLLGEITEAKNLAGGSWIGSSLLRQNVRTKTAQYCH
jgi:hypothetical protein